MPSSSTLAVPARSSKVPDWVSSASDTAAFETVPTQLRDRLAKWRAIRHYRSQPPLLGMRRAYVRGLHRYALASEWVAWSGGYPPPRHEARQDLLVRDEADIADAQIAYHLHAGVDFVIATDNRLRGRTTEILERHARTACSTIASPATTSARANGSRGWHGWRRPNSVPTGSSTPTPTSSGMRGTSLKGFALVRRRFGAIRGAWRNFVPRPDDARFFAERMTVRLCTPSFHPHPLSTHFKSAHRAYSDIRIGRGNHEALADDLVALRGVVPHRDPPLPVRSFEHCLRKYVTQFVALERNAEKGIPGHMAEATRRTAAAGWTRSTPPLVVDDERARGGARRRHLRDRHPAARHAPQPSVRRGG